MSNASCHFGAWYTSSGTRHGARRGSSSHSAGKNNRQSIGHDACAVTALMETPTWQLATLPNAPQYWRATPTDIRPNFGKPVSSITHASGAISALILTAKHSRTASADHGD